MFFDSHTHLNEKRLFARRQEILFDARKANVKALLIPSYDLPSIKNAITLTKEENVFAAIGIHPSDAKKYQFDVLLEIEALAKANKKVVAIGEIGLDYYWDHEEKAKAYQKEFFIKQIELANRLQLPIVVHMRDATQDTLELLRTNRPQFGLLMHCYSGSVEAMHEFLKLGAYISLGGPVTFLNAKEPKKVAAEVPLDRLLIETDAPYLAPHPYRGQLNEPKYLPLVAQEIARIRGISENEIAKVTFDNAWRFFHVEIK